MNDTLPSWHDTLTKQAILDFVAAVTDEADPRHVSPAERIAVFDNDGIKLGIFTLALEEQAQQSGWVVVSMKDDWKQIFPA